MPRQIDRLCNQTATELLVEFAEATRRLNTARTDATRERFARQREETRTRLLVCRAIDGRYFRPIARLIRAIVDRLTDLIVDQGANPASVRRAIEQADNEIFEGIRTVLGQVATDQIQERANDLRPRLNAPQLRQATGLSIDQFGNVRPESVIPPRIEDPNLPLREILEHMSPLLHIEGDSFLNQQIDVVGDLFRDVDPNTLVEAYDDRDAAISDNYRNKLGRVSAGINLSNQLRTDERRIEAVRQINDEYFGDGQGNAGILNRIRGELRHESLRIVKHSKEETLRRVDDNVLVGYVLYSRFLSTTDPVHAANSGNRYFKDNRSGRAATWGRRLIPPYRKNCVCYTLELFETPDGFLHTANFKAASLSGGRRIGRDDVGGEIWDNNLGVDNLGRRRGGFRRITEDDVGTVIQGGNAINVLEPRDVGDMRTWFNEQLPGIRRTLFGPRRFEAVQRRAAARGEPGYRPRYEDFVNVTGEVLTARDIERESKNRRAVRVRGVTRIIDQITANHHRAWEAGDGRFSLDPIQEGRMKRVLQRWLNNLPTQSRR